ncbi:MAG: mycofactocin biosynthesis peptidyl-dipeptidase MftE [Acidimicrobiales bacterium]
MRQLAALPWPAVAEQAPGWLLALPLGSTEQHGPHLPLDTDTAIATALAGRLAEARADVVAAPPIAYGSSGEHASFPGTLSIGGPARRTLLVELVRSADAFAGVVIVNGHGGNAAAVADATAALTGEGRRVLAWAPRRSVIESAAARVDAHAGRTETSIVLALAPESVHPDQAAAGCTRPLAELIASLEAGGVAAVTPNGVLGDPAGASASEGHALLDALTADRLAAVAAWSGAGASPRSGGTARPGAPR